MFKLPKTKKRKKIETENEALKAQVSKLEYQLQGAKEVDKFHAESERRAWKSKRFHEARAAKLKEESKALKDRLEAENRELKSKIREQGDADLMSLALQGAGLVLSKGAVDKFVEEEARAKENESVRKRMVMTGVESPLDEQRKHDCDRINTAHIAALSSTSRYGEGRGGHVITERFR